MSQSHKLAFARMSQSEQESQIGTLRSGLAAYRSANPQVSLAEHWRRKHAPEEAAAREALWRERESRASTGRGNPMFGRPSPGGSGYGWKGWLDGRFFRSLRELRFMLDHPLAETAESDRWRASFEWRGSERTTVADFILSADRVLVECKPSRLHQTPLVTAKARALCALAESRGWRFKLTDPGIVLHAELSQLIGAGRVVLTSKSKEKYHVHLDSRKRNTGVR